MAGVSRGGFSGLATPPPLTMEVIAPFPIKRQYSDANLGGGRPKRSKVQEIPYPTGFQGNRRLSVGHAEHVPSLGFVPILPASCLLGSSSGSTELASSTDIVQPLHHHHHHHHHQQQHQHQHQQQQHRQQQEQQEQQQPSLTQEFGHWLAQEQSYPITDNASSVSSHNYTDARGSAYNESIGSQIQHSTQPLQQHESWSTDFQHLLPQALSNPPVDCEVPIPSHAPIQGQVSAYDYSNGTLNAPAAPSLFGQTQISHIPYQNTLEFVGIDDQLVFNHPSVGFEQLPDSNELFPPILENTPCFSAWPDSQPEDALEEFEFPHGQPVERLEWPKAREVYTATEDHQQDLHQESVSTEQSSSISTLKSPKKQENNSNSPKRRPRGRFQNMKKREETSITRQNHACVRCRMQRVRCNIDEDDPSGVCITCRKVLKPTIHKLPCIRLILTDCTLYRTGNLGYSQRWTELKITEITDWDSTEIRMSNIKTSLPGFSLSVKFRRFKPIEGDQLRRTWVDGHIEKYHPVTPYAIASMEETAQSFRYTVDSVTFDCIDAVLARDQADELTAKTYDMAKQHTKKAKTPEERALMENVLRMWFMVHLSVGSAWLEGGDTLDMNPISDASSQLFGKVPHPPISSAQMDILGSVKILRPLQKKILDDLQRIIISNKPQYWITIYLCIFVLLHNCSTLTADRYRHARKHGLTTRYSLPQFVEQLHSSANNLLTHFHYYRGDMDPFFDNLKKRHGTRLAHMTPHEIGFLYSTSKIIKDKSDEFLNCKELNEFEHPLYFVSQMYEKDWNPRDIYRSPV